MYVTIKNITVTSNFAEGVLPKTFFVPKKIEQYKLRCPRHQDKVTSTSSTCRYPSNDESMIHEATEENRITEMISMMHA